MPNWCTNHVSFKKDDSPESIAFMEAFKLMVEEEAKKNEGQQIPGIGMEDWVHNISVDDEYTYVYFETKWGPIKEEMLKIGNHFKTDFELHYEEMGSLLYGTYFFKMNGEIGMLTEVSLTEEQINSVTEDANGEYSFRGEFIESRYDGYDTMMDENLLNTDLCIVY